MLVNRWQAAQPPRKTRARAEISNHHRRPHKLLARRLVRVRARALQRHGLPPARQLLIRTLADALFPVHRLLLLPLGAGKRNRNSIGQGFVQRRKPIIQASNALAIPKRPALHIGKQRRGTRYEPRTNQKYCNIQNLRQIKNRSTPGAVSSQTTYYTNS